MCCLPTPDFLRVLASQGAEERAKMAVGEAVGQQTEDAKGGKQALHAGAGDAKAGDSGPGCCDDRVVDGGEGGGAIGGVVADSLDVEQTSGGMKADLPQCWQVRQPFPRPKTAGLLMVVLSGWHVLPCDTA